MTTKQAEIKYEAEHMQQWGNKSWAVYNPKNKPVEDLPTIYGFNNGGGHQMLSACLLAEDGAGLGGHCCSSEGYMPHDLGIVQGSRPDRHAGFRKHYPEGYKMEFISAVDVKAHVGLKAAYILNQKNGGWGDKK